ncbi:MAG: hypothetical protein AB1298_02580, partial [Bacteroidota bacterium]
MNRKKSFDLTEKMLNKIISTAYGDASIVDKIKVLYIASRNKEIRRLLDSYKKTMAEIKRLEEKICPDELLELIARKNIPIAKDKNSFTSDLFSIIFTRPIISALTTIILIAAIITALIVNKPVKYSYTQAEIINAEKQAEHAFNIVNKIFKETHSTLQKEILSKRVAKPIGESIEIINNLFKGEIK